MWIHPLNVIDWAIRHTIQKYPGILLVKPVSRKKPNDPVDSSSNDAQILKDWDLSGPRPQPNVVEDLLIILRFLSHFLRNSFSKMVFHNSLLELTDLLSSSDDRIAYAAQEVLYQWTMPAQHHKQLAPEQAHTNSQNPAHFTLLPTVTCDRMMALARAWGTRAHHLGLSQICTADPATMEQLWPETPGQVHFDYNGDLSVHLSASELEVASTVTTGSDSQIKRRKITPPDAKPTADIFATALAQLEEQRQQQQQQDSTTDSWDSEKLFSLLADIRLARDYKRQSIPALKRRLQALAVMLYAHNSQEAVIGYFQAQPDLIVELVDLLRPTVSATHIAPVHANVSVTYQPDAVAHLADAQTIPCDIRHLALECLIGFVARRDGASLSGFTTEARISNVLTELGVGKGLYMGVLPTLLRYVLASLTTAASKAQAMAKSDTDVDMEDEDEQPNSNDDNDDDDVAMDIGLAFLEATAGPQRPRVEQVEEALMLMDAILSLTTTVTSTPTGTSALTESGIIPALLATVAMDANDAVTGLLIDGKGGERTVNPDTRDRIHASVRFLTAQCIQILEGVVIAQSNAMAAFTDLKGVTVMTERLAIEMKQTPTYSQRVLLFSLVTCLTVVFHQESNSSNTATTNTTSGSNELRKPELTDSIITILRKAPSYGGHLASLVATLLSDVLNHDPHIVNYVHESGIAKAFFDLVQGRTVDSTDSSSSADMMDTDGEGITLPAVPELVMALPNVISALALTENGAKAVKEANPFPSLMSLFYSPRFAMPESRCLLNELTAIIGTGLEEIMRHVEGVKPLVMKAIVEAIMKVISIGEDLTRKELVCGKALTSELERERSCLIQYTLNMGQLLEQVLHNDDHVEPFVEAGGFPILFDLYTQTMPKGWSFLAHVSPLSSVTVSTLHHSTVEDSLNLAFKCIFLKHAPEKAMAVATEATNKALLDYEAAQKALSEHFQGNFDKENLLQYLPNQKDLCDLSDDEMPLIACGLETMSSVIWHSGVLSLAIKAAGRRMDDFGGSAFGTSASQAELTLWRKFFSSQEFTGLLERLTTFSKLGIRAVCDARAALIESSSSTSSQPESSLFRFRLRIVCPEGAVVRNGIEIDSCASVGSMEMGEIATASNRCINSSGILRYHTDRGGWISEMTRGHGREPITEVVHVSKSSESSPLPFDSSGRSSIICPIPSIKELAVGILSRLQRTYGELCTSLSRLTIQSFRTLGTRSPSFEEGSHGSQLATMLKLLFDTLHDSIDVSHEKGEVTAGAAMYYGCMLDQLLTCIFVDERRERRVANFLLLAKLVGFQKDTPSPLFDCVGYVFEHCLCVFAKRVDNPLTSKEMLSRSVASCYPPLLKFLRRLMSTPISSSPVATVMSRLKAKTLAPLLGDDCTGAFSSGDFFQPEAFVSVMQLKISRATFKTWEDPRFAHAPPHQIHPMLSLVGDVVVTLEESSKKQSSRGRSGSRSESQSRTLLSDWIREQSRLEQQQQAQAAQEFEPSEEAISQLEEMGFSRDHALDALENTRSNRVDVAMEYALTHAAPSAEDAARRRAQREERNRQREQAAASDSAGDNSNEGEGANAANDNNATNPSNEVANNPASQGGNGGSIANPAESEQARGTDDAMDVESKEPENGKGDKDEPDRKSKEVEEKEENEVAVELRNWINLCFKVLVDIISWTSPHSPQSSSEGDAESEATTVVVTSFLLDLCHRYEDKKDEAISLLLDAFNDKLTSTEVGREFALAKLAHAVVLLTKAVPKARFEVLKKGIVSPVVSMVSSYVQNNLVRGKVAEGFEWPIWLPHFLILLDVMAQPAVAFSNEDIEKAQDAKNSEMSADYYAVIADHKFQSEAVSKALLETFKDLVKTSGQSKPSSSSGKSDSKQSSDSRDEGMVDSDNESLKSLSKTKLPAFCPLLPSKVAGDCLKACQGLIGCERDCKMAPPPGILQACLMLLLRLLRDPSASADCIKHGVADAIFKSSASSRFIGNSGLVTQILRRLLEDEHTLMTAMETEIRTAVARLQKKQQEKANQTDSIRFKSFMEVSTPFLCRDPSAFLKALPMSLKIVDPSSSDPRVQLLPIDERPKKIPIPQFETLTPSVGEASPTKAKMKRSSSGARRRSSGSHKVRSASKSRKKRGNSDSQRDDITHGVATPASSITFRLIGQILRMDKHFGFEESENVFLTQWELLGILSDLILSVPACASCVHNYRPHRDKAMLSRAQRTTQFSHACSGAQAPPRTFVNYLLHVVLAQDRWSLRHDEEIWNRKRESIPDSTSVRERKHAAARVLKSCQAASRVLLALSGRPGEGRKRVVADLVFALSCGRLGRGTGSSPGDSLTPSITAAQDSELHALHAWGEICLGLAVPRGGKNLEQSLQINYEVVRIMFENGMVHALTVALHKVPLTHQMTSTVFASLLLPFELLTRANVSNNVVELIKRTAKPTSSDVSNTILTGTEEAEGTAFLPSLPPAPNQDEVHDAEEMEVDEEDEIESESSSIEEDDDDGDEIEEASDDEGSEMSEDSEESGSSAESSVVEEVDDGGAWNNFDADNAFAVENPASDENGVEDEGPSAQGIGDGWTRIDSSGLGGMFLGSLSGSRRPNGSNGDQGGTRGFVDAAEAMISTLLRSGAGEINQESLAEIEGQLGIRIMGAGSRRLRQAGGPGGGFETSTGDNLQVFGLNRGQNQSAENRLGNVIGTLPHVHQRNQPEAGFSGFGTSSARTTDLTSIELVFGGPSVSAGSRNFNVHLRDELDYNVEEVPHFTQLDLQLFPGGPAAAANTRSQLAMHPLLSGVDLPPINALVSDLRPHGARARRSSQNGHRRTAAPLSTGVASRSTSSPMGWADDALPFDTTVEQLGSVIQSELTRSLQQNATTIAEAARPSANESNEATSSSEGANADSSIPSNALQHNDSSERPNEAESHDQEGDTPSTASEGERVASSLANGLRLSSSADVSENANVTNPEGQEENANIEADALGASQSNDNVNIEDQQGGTDAMEEDGPPPAVEGQPDVQMADQREQEMEDEDEESDEEAEGSQNQDNNISEQAAEDNDQSDRVECPPSMEPDVFHSLPIEMQREMANEYAQSQDFAAQVEGTSLDPEVLAELPEDMRRDVIAQARREQMREAEAAAPPVDPARAEEMDNANFIASLSPDLRADILLTMDDDTLSTLPQNLIAEANVLRERAQAQQPRAVEQPRQDARRSRAAPSDGGASASRKKPQTGKIKAELDREDLVFAPENMSQPIAATDIALFLKLFFLLSPIRPIRLLQKIMQNLISQPGLREVISTSLLQLLHNNQQGVSQAVQRYAQYYSSNKSCWRKDMDSSFPLTGSEDFPPATLLGVAPEIPKTSDVDSFSTQFTKLKQGLSAAAAVATSMPKSMAASNDSYNVPPVIVARLVDTLQHLSKNSNRFTVHSLETKVPTLSDEQSSSTCFESMIDMIHQDRFLRSSAFLDHLLSLLETVAAPLSSLPRGSDEASSIPQREIDAATAAGKEWVDVPPIVMSQERLQALCSILRMESCRDSAFGKVNTILRRICRVEINRRHVLAELASVAHSLGQDAIRDLKALKVRMEEAVEQQEALKSSDHPSDSGKLSNSVSFSTSTSELKLLRVLQTLQSMCADVDESHGKRDQVWVTEELFLLLRQLDFSSLWNELSSCLKMVQVLHGVSAEEEGKEKPGDVNDQDDGSADGEGTASNTKKLRSSSAGLLTRFLPSIEAFFVAIASATRPKEGEKADSDENIVGIDRLVDFVAQNKVLLNALVRNNPGLLDRGMKALVHVPRCRAALDFDVKRQWFKTQMRRLRQHASRRYGNIRLNIGRRTVFEEAYHNLRLRSVEEMRGRLHITFRDEDGIDAGGLSREFFAILAKEMFNPNYALFTSTEDGCTFQPNPHSSFNPDHLSYFRFCGRIVGKAVADGYLLDAHFTRSLYKHMLGIKPSHQDMEAIDPDYYRNLKTILQYDLEDLGLDLFFCVDDNSFGGRKVHDLKPGGRKIPVTEENKEEYVQLVCEHRMTTSIQHQIKAYLDGFYEMVSPDLVAIFTPRELELVISGLPDIDIADLKKNTDYVGWKATDKEIGWFWSVLATFNRNEKAAFLQFVTGSSKVPLAGFGELQGMRGQTRFSVHKCGDTTSRNKDKALAQALPSAHTCFNSLDLPTYSSEVELKEKLLMAINEGNQAGFGFA